MSNQRTSRPQIQKTVNRWSRQTATLLEHLLAAAIVTGVILFGLASLFALADANWQDSEVFYDLVYRVLLMVIGVELARTLLTHDLGAILELLAFVVARKMLKPDITSIDIILSVLAFVALLAAKFYFLMPRHDDDDDGPPPTKSGANPSDVRTG